MSNKKIIFFVKDFIVGGVEQVLVHAVNALANADIIALSASDDVLMPNYIEDILKEFKDKTIGVVYPVLQYMSEEYYNYRIVSRLHNLFHTQDAIYRSYRRSSKFQYIHHAVDLKLCIFITILK